MLKERKCWVMAWNGTQYVADYAGQSEAERVQRAIDFYSKNNMPSQLKGATDYWESAGLSNANQGNTNNYNVSPKADTTSYKRTSTTLNTGQKQYYVPGQQSWEDAIAALNFTPRSQKELQGQAESLADVQINPQKTALQTALRNAMASLKNQENTVNANYAGLAANKDAAIETASKRALESAISRGGGRSGVVEWATAENTKPIQTAYMQAEAQKLADLNNLANNRTLAQSNYDAGISALEEQRGSLVASQLAALLSGDQDRAMQYAQMRASAEQNLATLLNARDMYNIDAVRADTQLTGIAGGGLDATVPLRQYLVDNGVSDSDIAWNAADQSVTINGRKYSSSQLSGIGGYIENGRWQIPESAIQGML